MANHHKECPSGRRFFRLGYWMAMPLRILAHLFDTLGIRRHRTEGVRLLTHQPQRYEGTALLHDARSKQTWRHQRPEARPGGDGVVVDMSVWLKRFEERKGKRQG